MMSVKLDCSWQSAGQVSAVSSNSQIPFPQNVAGAGVGVGVGVGAGAGAAVTATQDAPTNWNPEGQPQSLGQLLCVSDGDSHKLLPHMAVGAAALTVAVWVPVDGDLA
jgi:hypothetical protein